MGRPRVEDQHKRIVQVNIRLTQEEHKKISQYSQANGLSPANWIRRKVNELRSMGVNLNQIAHKINQGDDYRSHFNVIIDMWITIKGILKQVTNDRQPG